MRLFILAIISLFISVYAEQSLADECTEPLIEGSGFVSGGCGFELHDKSSVVVIYTHGSAGDQVSDRCWPKTEWRNWHKIGGNMFMPRSLWELQNRIPNIALFYHCHREKGDIATKAEGVPDIDKRTGKTYFASRFERTRREPCVASGRSPDTEAAQEEFRNRPKFCKRVDQIIDMVKRIRRENGLSPSSAMFLAGGSSGGWTSLIASAKHKELVRGVIAYAPATNGKLWEQWQYIKRKLPDQASGKVDKRCGINPENDKLIPRPGRKKSIFSKEIDFRTRHYLAHLCQQEFIAREVPSALVFAFENDPYNAPEFLELLSSENTDNRIQFINVPTQDRRSRECGRTRFLKIQPHSCHQSKKFVEHHLPKIEDYIFSRL